MIEHIQRVKLVKKRNIGGRRKRIWQRRELSVHSEEQKVWWYFKTVIVSIGH